MIRGLAVVAILALSACSAVQETADGLARAQAKDTVNGIVADRLPGVNVSAVTDCIIDAASAQEILRIASASVTGDTSDIPSLVLDIAQRPEAVECIAAAQLRSFQL
ncbi:succinate dehydrogenase [Pseudaestuariivita sp.]|uniref:succinate dehydrogenase n=1 Tax=Pseudaestuariivita sp. TaxID=2211669 RepID=UPI00405916EE